MSREALSNQQKQRQKAAPVMKSHDDYNDFIKSAVADGSYFKDALDWYMLTYVNPVVDRTIMVVVSIFASVALYFLVQIISNAFPLVEEVPVVIRDYDASVYRPIITDLYDEYDEGVENVDEAVARYLLTNYINERESYDFRDSNVARVNSKFTKIKNNSSFAEYKNFQLFMSRDNANSPINNFGRNIYQTSQVDAVEFIRDAPKNQYQKLKWMFSNRIPRKANIKFTVFVHSLDADGKNVTTAQKYLAKVDFLFAGLDRNAKTGVLNFVVNEYKLFKIK